MVKITRYLDPAPANGEGGNGGGTGANPPELSAEQQQEVAQLETLLSKSDLTDDEKQTLEQLQEKYDVAELDEDGKPLTAEAKAAALQLKGELEAIEAKPEAERTAEEKALLAQHTVPDTSKKNVYEEVDELLGIPVKLEYGDVDPTSAEGIAKRESYIRKQGADSFETTLKETYPRGYQFLAHLSRGGSEEDFFKPENQDFLTVKLSKTDEAVQESILRKALAIKGNSPNQIDILVTSSKDAGKLFEDSTIELNALQKRQEAQEQAIAEEEERQIRKQEQDVQTFHTVLQSAVEQGINGTTIPVADRRNFISFVSNNIRYQEGKFLQVLPLDPKEIQKVLQVEYFRFKGGDITKLAENKAKTQVAKKFKLGVNRTITPKSASGVGNKNFKPMSQI